MQNQEMQETNKVHGSLQNMLQLLQEGSAVADPAKWKARQVQGSAVAAVILLAANIATAVGFPLPIDPSTANSVGIAVVTLWNIALTYSTSDKVGLFAKAGEKEVQE